ncbi:E3 ubiquitin-protein ligase RNF182 [Aix galericulata]|nr:E3 ubiquitin-protein ligase RNF182 [Aix galericulata]
MVRGVNPHVSFDFEHWEDFEDKGPFPVGSSHESPNCLVIMIMEVQRDSPRTSSQTASLDYYADRSIESASASLQSQLDQDLFSKLCNHVYLQYCSHNMDDGECQQRKTSASTPYSECSEKGHRAAQAGTSSGDGGSATSPGSSSAGPPHNFYK